jgi:hypothetical protein
MSSFSVRLQALSILLTSLSIGQVSVSRSLADCTQLSLWPGVVTESPWSKWVVPKVNG